MTTRDLSFGLRVSDQFITDNPGVDASAVEVAIKLHGRFRAGVEGMESVLAPFGLGKGGYNLMVLAERDRRSRRRRSAGDSSLAARRLPASSTRLIQRGYAEHAADPSVRRRVLVAITPQGRGLVAGASAVIVRSDEEVMAIFTEAERERLTRMRGRRQNHLKKLTA